MLSERGPTLNYSFTFPIAFQTVAMKKMHRKIRDIITSNKSEKQKLKAINCKYVLTKQSPVVRHI
jgi:hypothetical protein